MNVFKLHFPFFTTNSLLVIITFHNVFTLFILVLKSVSSPTYNFLTSTLSLFLSNSFLNVCIENVSPHLLFSLSYSLMYLSTTRPLPSLPPFKTVSKLNGSRFNLCTKTDVSCIKWERRLPLRTKESVSVPVD